MRSLNTSVLSPSRLILGLVLLGAIPGHFAWAQPPGRSDSPDLKAIQNAFSDLADRVRPSVVALRTYRQLEGHPGMDARGVARVAYGHGSGVILRADGTILTNDHVLADADVIKVVLQDGSEHEARLVQRDVRADMAVVRIQAASLRPATLGNAADVRVGQWCFAVGNPFGIAYDGGGSAFTEGIVSGLGRNLTPHLDDTDTRYYGDLIQTTADINPGNSGGPLFDLEGRMIGLVTAILSRSGVTEGRGFAIPLDERTRRIIDTLAAGEPVRYGYLGVKVGTPHSAGGLAGAAIIQIDDRDGPAAKAHLRADDLIVEFAGVPIRNSDQLVRVVGATPVGSLAKVRYVRADQTQEATIAVAERPGLQRPVPAVTEDEVLAERWRGAVLAEMDDATLREHGMHRDQAGIMVASLEPISDARSAGLKAGDVILSYNGTRVRTLDEFVEVDGRDARSIKLELRGGRTIRMRR